MWLRYHNFFVFIFSFVGNLALALANFKGKESIEGIEGRERLKPNKRNDLAVSS